MVGGPIWMLKKFFGLIWVVSLLIQIALIVGYFKFYRRGAETTEVPVPATMAEAVFNAVAKVPPTLPKAEIAMRPTLVLPLKEDRESQVTTALRTALSKAGNYRAVELGTLDKLFAKFGLTKAEVTSPQKALELAEAAHAEVVLLGEIQRLTEKDGKWTVAFDLEMYDVESKERIFKRSFAGESSTDETAPTASSEAAKADNRYFYAGLGCFALFWPLLLMPVIRKIVRAENNAMTAAALLFVVAVPLMIGWTRLFGPDWGFWSIVLFLLGGAAIALWTIYVMSRVAEAESY